MYASVCLTWLYNQGTAKAVQMPQPTPEAGPARRGVAAVVGMVELHEYLKSAHIPIIKES